MKPLSKREHKRKQKISLKRMKVWAEGGPSPGQQTNGWPVLDVDWKRARELGIVAEGWEGFTSSTSQAVAA